MDGHFEYHKKELIVGTSGGWGLQGNVIKELYSMDVMQEGVLMFTSLKVTKSADYLRRSAELIRSHSGLQNIPNRNGWKGSVVLDHSGPRLVNVIPASCRRVSQEWYVTPEFLALVASFCDIRTT